MSRTARSGRRTIRPAAAGVAAALAALAALLTGACGDATDTASTSEPAATGLPADWLDKVADSAELDEPVVARGRVVLGDGSGVADADVVLLVWPGQAVLATTDVGDSFEVRPVARARTSDDGGFELRIAEARLADLPDDPSGFIDFEIHAIAPEGQMVYGWTADEADPAAAEPVTVDINIVDMTFDDGTDAATMEEPPT
jgi:hypothetical protein